MGVGDANDDGDGMLVMVVMVMNVMVVLVGKLTSVGGENKAQEAVLQCRRTMNVTEIMMIMVVVVDQIVMMM